MCFNARTQADPARQANGAMLAASAFGAAMGSKAAAGNLAKFKTMFRANHNGMTAAQLNASTTGGAPSVTGA